jgi:hypothetical protein
MLLLSSDRSRDKPGKPRMATTSGAATRELSPPIMLYISDGDCCSEAVGTVIPDSCSIDSARNLPSRVRLAVTTACGCSVALVVDMRRVNSVDDFDWIPEECAACGT